tara:strand:+ start:439 stop:837 length:399 start_codon:yes stop_codon:yes gene_type:complete
MAREVTTTGSKKLKTIKKEFNKHFPYLSIHFHSSDVSKIAKKGGSLPQLDSDKTLSEVREKIGSGKISLTGRKKVKTVEEEFDEIFGLFVQVTWRTGEGGYHYSNGGRTDELTLTALNREKEAQGCEKGKWE